VESIIQASTYSRTSIVARQDWQILAQRGLSTSGKRAITIYEVDGDSSIELFVVGADTVEGGRITSVSG